MTSLTQIVVGKGKSNPLIVEGLLKILRDSLPLDFHQSPLPILFNRVAGPQKSYSLPQLSELRIELVML